MFEARIAIVGADAGLTARIRSGISRVRGTGFHLSWKGVDEALQFDQPDLVLICADGASNRRNAVDLLQTLSQLRKAIPAIVLLSYVAIDDRTLFTRWGAVDCLTLPSDSARLAFLTDLLTVRCTRKPVQRNSGNPSARRMEELPTNDDGFLSPHPSYKNLLAQIFAVAEQDTAILLTGETGTGKTHLARVIHARSSRRQRPFVTVACNRVSDLKEHFLLPANGHRPHLAANRREEESSKTRGGTILLDDIDKAPLDLQVPLLRFVEQNASERKIASDSIEGHSRVIVTASRRPFNRAGEGRPEGENYTPASIAEFEIPPLRNCRSMIRPLSECCLGRLCSQNGHRCRSLSEQAISVLELFAWPGNFRQLQSVLEHAIAACKGDTIDLAHLPDVIRDSRPIMRSPAIPEKTQARNSLEFARNTGEFKRLAEVLRNTGNNRTQAAKELGISRVALYKKLRKYCFD